MIGSSGERWEIGRWYGCWCGSSVTIINAMLQLLERDIYIYIYIYRLVLNL